MKRAFIAVLGVVVLTALTGCSGSVATIPAKPEAQTAPTGFVESDKAGDIPVTLRVEPFKPGENTFVLTTPESGIAAAEVQVIMLEMGHGAILDMAQTAPGRYEVSSSVIDMDGKWMLRVKLTTTAGEEKLVPFYGKIKTEQ
ncbi:MAG: hypothetical protein ACOY93_20215 [Bacillota bacterium]